MELMTFNSVVPHLALQRAVCTVSRHLATLLLLLYVSLDVHQLLLVYFVRPPINSELTSINQ